jgi:hypothetical protein
MRAVSGGNQCLCRDAACIHARSTEALPFDYGHLSASGSHPDSQKRSCLAASNDDRIKVFFHNRLTTLAVNPDALAILGPRETESTEASFLGPAPLLLGLARRSRDRQCLRRERPDLVCSAMIHWREATF